MERERERERKESFQRVAEDPVLGIAVVNTGAIIQYRQGSPTNRRLFKQPFLFGYTHGDAIDKQA